MASPNEIAACKKKVRYSSDPSAQEALKRINPTKKAKKPYRVYRCPVCSGWHLTSSSKR